MKPVSVLSVLLNFYITTTTSSLAFQLQPSLSTAPHRRQGLGSSSTSSTATTSLRAQQAASSSSSSSSTPQQQQQQQNKNTNYITLELTKPLGLILEEVIEKQPRGVLVTQVNEGGSAYPHADFIRGCKLAKVQGRDVTKMLFDSVMDAIVSAPEKVQIDFIAVSDGDEAMVPSLPLGTPVTLVYQTERDGKTKMIQAKVGDNLRQTLINNNIEVYQGLSQAMGNCGGAGQCKLCAMDFIESPGWMERSDYEDQKLKRFPKARLSCLNSIQGPATIQKTKQ